MTVKKVKGFVEVSGDNIYMWLPANQNGYNVFLNNGGSKEHESLFDIKKKVVVKVRKAK